MPSYNDYRARTITLRALIRKANYRQDSRTVERLTIKLQEVLKRMHEIEESRKYIFTIYVGNGL